MEPIMGAIAEGEWSSLSGMYTIEEADFIAQLLGSSILANSSSSSSSSTFWPSHGACNGGSYYSLDSGSSIFFPSSTSQESFYLSDSHPILGTNDSNNSTNSLDFCLIDDQGDECLNNQENNLNDGNNPEPGFPAKTPQLEKESESSKKRSRNAADVQKNKKRNGKSKKNKKNAAAVSAASSINEEDNNESNAGANRLLQPSSSCCSKDESNASQDQNGGEDSSMSSKGKAAPYLNGKTRASKGSATNPQSLYARKRRERINEKLRILQNLVPNGTKVDISTMLEEAVQYVNFLQLQIKLLSSDDLWMYAPIAYNGMNIGPDLLKLAAASKLS